MEREEAVKVRKITAMLDLTLSDVARLLRSSMP